MSENRRKSEEKWAEIKKFIEEQRGSPLSTARQVREQAARLYEEFLETLPLRSRQMYFVTLKLDTPYPTAVPRKDIPDMIREYPEFYRDWAEATGG